MEQEYNRIENDADQQKSWPAVSHIGSSATRKALNLSAFSGSKIDEGQTERAHKTLNRTLELQEVELDLPEDEYPEEVIQILKLQASTNLVISESVNEIREVRSRNTGPVDY